MNATVYLFGDLGDGYSQYPTDYTQSIFQGCYDKSKAQTQLIIRREKELMYYIYLRKLENTLPSTQYLGICIMVNGIMYTDFVSLFSIFENSFTNLVVNGEIVGFESKGNIISKVLRLKDKVNEIERVSRFIRGEIGQLVSLHLPPVDYSIADGEIKSFSITDNQKEIEEASYKYGYTFIYKNSDYDTNSLRTYRGVIKNLNKEKEDIEQKLREVTSLYQKTLRRKKQIGGVVVLLIIIFIGTMVGLKVKDDMQNQILDLGNNVAILNETNSNLQTTIEDRNLQLSSKDGEIDLLKQKLLNVKNAKEELEQKVIEQEGVIKNQEDGILRREDEILRREDEIRKLKDELHTIKNTSFKQQDELLSSFDEDIYITNPTVMSTDVPNNDLRILSVEITFARTVIELEYENLNHLAWININPNTNIVSYNTGRKYKLTLTDGIASAPRKTYLNQKGIRFKLIFPALPKNTTQFNLIEEGGWKLYGVKLK